MAGITWDSKLATVAGQHASKIEKAFGYTTVGDLLLHYPRRWVERGQLSEVESLTVDDYLTVQARVASAKQHQYVDRRTHRPAWRLEVMLQTEGPDLLLTFFDKRKHIAVWRQAEVAPGRIGLFSGRLGRWRDHWQLVNPETQVWDEGEGSTKNVEDLPNLLAIYPATTAVQSWQLADTIATALDLVDEVPETLPAETLEGRDLLPARQALEWIHRPDSWSQKGAAERRLRLDEAFVTQAVLALRRTAVARLDCVPRNGRVGGLLDRFDERLPFELTAGQRAVSHDIDVDLAAGHPMHRLLQGEVGSGKTVVALRAMLRVVDSGGQAALLAPTEVLAQQHQRSISALLGDLAAGGMLGGAEDGTQVALLTGSLSASARRSALLDAASGSAGIVIGTHALLEDIVQFADLGLVVVDEQHRFGVEQRAALTAKAD